MGDFADYQAATRWLLSTIRGPAESTGALPPPDLAERHRQRFARLHAFLAQLGRPERQYTTLHVAGTSGKGSTAAVLASIMQAAGWRTGLHVTPYLQTPLEKLIINGRMMNVERFVRLVWRLRAEVERFNAASAEGPLRYGELWVALTFAAYAAERVDVGVVEAGLGGRWDSTNVITPAAAVINRIGLDHVRSLGPTLADIAYHKAGVIKPGVPIVVAQQPAEALAVIDREAALQRAPLLLAGRDFGWTIDATSAEGSTFSYHDAAGSLASLALPLLGDYQVANASLAIAAARAMPAGAPLTDDAIRTGVARVRFPGRLERMQLAPEVRLDGAHNAQKAQALAAALGPLRAGRRLVLVLGVLASHPPRDIVRALAPLADLIVCTTPRVLGKAPAPPAELAALCQELGAVAVVEPEPLDAVERALASAGSGDLICVTGSLYLVGNVRGRWQSEADLLRAAWSAAADPLPAALAAV